MPLNLSALKEEGHLPICTTCGTQFDPDHPGYVKGECRICLDDRQFVNPRGQEWTTLSKMEEEGYKNELIPHESDHRIMKISTVPSFAIGQFPHLLRLSTGLLIWDCISYLSPTLALQINSMTSPTYPLLGIMISHPHFYTTSITWAKVFGCKVFVSKEDEGEWCRDLEVDGVAGLVVRFEGGELRLDGVDEVTMIRCGGHFDGSCVLHWDRSLHSSTSTSTNAKTTGVVFCSDTFAVSPSLRNISFMWSYPNQIPLPPSKVLGIWRSVEGYGFEDIFGMFRFNNVIGGGGGGGGGGVGGREGEGDGDGGGSGKELVRKSAERFVRMEGWEPGDVGF